MRQNSKFVNSSFIVMPRVSGETRRYIPFGFVERGTIPGDSVMLANDCSLYHFGILESSVHMAWMRVVAGRLKSDYRYSSDIVYNNFPWPSPTIDQVTRINHTAQGILDARSRYPDSSLDDLYDESLMPIELRSAHRANDAAVMAAYGFRRDMSETDVVAELFKMYKELTTNK